MVVLRVLLMCFLLFGSGACYPAREGGQTPASSKPDDGSARYAAAPASYGSGYGSAGYAAAPASYGSGYGSAGYAAAPASYGSGYGSAGYAAAPASYGSGYGSAGYAAAPASYGSGGGPAPGSNLQSEGSRPPLVSLQHEAAPQQPSSPTGNQSPSSVGAPGVAAGSSASYEPNRFIVTYESSSNKPSSAPVIPSQNTGYASPPVGPLPPAGTGKKTPSFFVQPQPVGTSGNSNMGSNVAAFSPVYEASKVPPPSGAAYPAGNMATAYGYGYAAAPASYSYGYAAAPASYGSGYGSAGYAAAPASYDSGAGPVPGLPRDEQPAGGAYGSFSDPSNWMPSRLFPDFSAWDSNNEMPQSASETSPLPPSSYIIQSRNGYQRAREVLSHTKYSPEYPEPPVFAYKAVKAPSKSPPVTGSKGGTKAH